MLKVIAARPGESAKVSQSTLFFAKKNLLIKVVYFAKNALIFAEMFQTMLQYLKKVSDNPYCITVFY